MNETNFWKSYSNGVNSSIKLLTPSNLKPLKLIQNPAARLIFNESKRTHITSLFINLHWLPITARITFKALMFAYKTPSGSAPLYLNSLLQTYMPSRSLRSASERRIIEPSQRGTKSLSQTFSFTVPIWWNDLPNSIRAAESLAISWYKRGTAMHRIFITYKIVFLSFSMAHSTTCYGTLVWCGTVVGKHWTNALKHKLSYNQKSYTVQSSFPHRHNR